MIAIQLAIKNVYRKRERSFLTIIGVLLAVGSFISLLSIAEGLYQRVSSELNNRAVDIYILPGDAAALPTGPVGTIGFSSNVLPKDLTDRLKEIQEIESICPINRIQQKLSSGQTVVIWGVDSEKFRRFFPKFQLETGRMFIDKNNEIVVGSMLAREAGIRLQTPLLVEGQVFDTTGIGKRTNTFQDFFCFISLEKAMQIQKARGYQEIWLQIQAGNRAERDSFAAVLRDKLSDLDVKVKTREDYLGSANEFVGYAWLMQFAIAAIGVLIAMTASMNTMLMSTYERIKEFGTLRAIGASRFTVFVMILMESMMLTFVGGVGGILLGIMGSRVLDEAVKALFQLSFPLAKITPHLLIYAVVLCFFVGIVGAIIPAILVYKMKVITALRWE